MALKSLGMFVCTLSHHWLTHSSSLFIRSPGGGAVGVEDG